MRTNFNYNYSVADGNQSNMPLAYIPDDGLYIGCLEISSIGGETGVATVTITTSAPHGFSQIINCDLSSSPNRGFSVFPIAGSGYLTFSSSVTGDTGAAYNVKFTII